MGRSEFTSDSEKFKNTHELESLNNTIGDFFNEAKKHVNSLSKYGKKILACGVMFFLLQAPRADHDENADKVIDILKANNEPYTSETTNKIIPAGLVQEVSAAEILGKSIKRPGEKDFGKGSKELNELDQIEKDYQEKLVEFDELKKEKIDDLKLVSDKYNYSIVNMFIAEYIDNQISNEKDKEVIANKLKSDISKELAKDSNFFDDHDKRLNLAGMSILSKINMVADLLAEEKNKIDKKHKDGVENVLQKVKSNTIFTWTDNKDGIIKATKEMAQKEVLENK
jgi:hypothetical protein